MQMDKKLQSYFKKINIIINIKLDTALLRIVKNCFSTLLQIQCKSIALKDRIIKMICSKLKIKSIHYLYRH